jgi:hypothetical protein
MAKRKSPARARTAPPRKTTAAARATKAANNRTAVKGSAASARGAAKPKAGTSVRRPGRAAAAPARGKNGGASSKARKAPNAPNAAKAARSAKPSGAAKTVTAAPRTRASAMPASPRKRKAAAPRTKPARVDRAREEIEEFLPTPPSSLDLDRRASAARSGRAELTERVRDEAVMSSGITGGDVDIDVTNAYFSGEEAPGGDMPSPDQDIVDDIGRAIGVEYQDNEELRSGDKLEQRDKHRWELDPASAEDYKDRK